MDTECDVDRSAGRGFNLSALYALLTLVAIIALLLIFRSQKHVSGVFLGAEFDREIQHWAKILGTYGVNGVPTRNIKLTLPEFQMTRVLRAS